jgi:fucose permease
MQGKEIIRLAQSVDILAYAVIAGLLFVASALVDENIVAFILMLMAFVFLSSMFSQSSLHKKELRHYGLYVEEDNDE